ncbi:hypothetical protein RCG19_15910 [Neobacillus sp. OS1-2]|uniref:hypothetical protein n=1 Tax=Neobacillus sp. OS1-2 TaxID=3070680 RepID=UPI0027E1E86C|nr:hypothetical protein [Neobacillus sp. OS1-2]WML38673.1 hypothetical protein RCG19_15910 [Neobacillus sp. OS1-2]
MSISEELLNHVPDGDLHTKLGSVEYSTNIREIVTVGQMIERYQEGLKKVLI